MPIVINYHPLSVAVTACCVNISKPIVMSKGLALFGTSSQQSRLIGVGSKLKPHPNGPTDATKVGPCRALIYVTATDLGSKVWHGMAPWHQVVECVFQQDDWLPQLASWGSKFEAQTKHGLFLFHWEIHHFLATQCFSTTHQARPVNDRIAVGQAEQNPLRSCICGQFGSNLLSDICPSLISNSVAPFAYRKACWTLRFITMDWYSLLVQTILGE